MNPETTYGRYKVAEKLGSGAMGIVYKAHDPRLNRFVALKVMRPDQAVNSGFVRRFEDEAVAVGKLSHPNIVSVFDRGKDHDTLYIAMELLEGQSLKEVIASDRPDHQKTVRIGVQVAEALDYAHKKGIVHRDIKPSNIIMQEGDRVKITDFGIARIEDPDVTRNTQAGQIMGTPCYMSPEQTNGDELDGRSDIFSLGVVLYEIVTGKKPFVGATSGAIYNAILNNTPAAPHTLNPKVPPALSQVIMRCIAKHPDDRFQDGQALAHALNQCLQRRKTDQDDGRSFREKSKLKRLVVSILIVLALTAVTIARLKPFLRTPHLTATLIIQSDPTDAQVFIDGDLKGNTPLQLDLILGTYEIRLSKPQYHHWEAQINLDRRGRLPIFGNLLPMDNPN